MLSHVLNGIDDIEWESFDGAYGPCTEAPDILRAIASPDPEVAAEGRHDFFSSIWHQNTVYPVTAEIVPFLVELATTGGVHRRDHLLRVLGGLCDPDQAGGPDQPTVRAAVAVHSGPLLPLLADPDPAIRAHAAYAAAWSGPHAYEALQERWASERDAGVRAAVLPGLAHLEPALTEPLLEAALHDPAPEIRAAAAGTLVRSGHSLPSAALDRVADAFALVQPGAHPWPGWDQLPTDTAATLAGRMTASTNPAARIGALRALAGDFRQSRSAPLRRMSLVRGLLADADPGVREAAADTALAAGEAAAPMADALLALVDDREDSIANTALGILVRLGHPAYPDALATAWAAGRGLDVLSVPEPPTFDPVVLAAVRRRLGGPRISGFGDAVHATADLIGVLAAWGPAAAGAVPEIMALMSDDSPSAVTAAGARALAAAGTAALPAVPTLAGRAARGDVRAGHAVLRLTGDTGPLIDAATIRVADGPRRVGHHELELIADAGPAAVTLLPSLTPWLGAAPAGQHDQRREQVAAALVAWRATGDRDLILPTLRAVVRAGSNPAGDAAALLAELSEGADLSKGANLGKATDLGEGADLLPQLRELLRAEPYARSGAARALRNLGVPPGELAGPLVEALAHGTLASREIIDTLVAIGATDAVPALAELAGRDERIPASGLGDPSWSDDLLRRRLRAAIAALAEDQPGGRAAAGSGQAAAG